MSNHTKEPRAEWRISESPDPYTGRISIYSHSTSGTEQIANDVKPQYAREIIAHRNALAGINPEAVGEMFRIFKDIHHILKLDRGDYRGAGSQEMFTIDALYDHFDNMEAAIALAESED